MWGLTRHPDIRAKTYLSHSKLDGGSDQQSIRRFVVCFQLYADQTGNNLRERANRSVGVNTLDDFTHGAWALLEQEGYVVEVL